MNKSITPQPPANFSPEMSEYRPLHPFRYWCQKVLPLVYDDSLSYYELLCKVVDFLNNTIENVDALHNDTVNLHGAYVKLQRYVNNYFSSLDVQEEINNKLDEMSENGELTEIIKKYVYPLINEQNKKITVLENRMDTFASLEHGSTTADAELIDIRVPANGFHNNTPYATAGDAVRGQVSELNEDLNTSAVKFKKLLPSEFYDLNDINETGVWQINSIIMENVKNAPTTNSGCISSIFGIDFIIQYYFDTSGVTYYRHGFIKTGLSKWKENYKPFAFKGIIPPNFYTLSKINEIGYWQITTAILNEIIGLETINVSGFIMNLIGDEYTVQIYLTKKNELYLRNRISDAEYSPWVKIGVKNNERKYVVTGDSIARGAYSSGAWDNFTYHNPTDESGWVNTLSNIKGYNIDNKAKEGTAFTYKFGGTSAFDLLKNINLKIYDEIIICYGSNDWAHNGALGDINDSTATNSVCGKYKEYLNYIFEQNPSITVTTLSPVNRATFGDSNSFYGINGKNNATINYSISELVEKMKTISKNYGVRYIDLLHSSNISFKNIKNCLPDKTHPSLECYINLGYYLSKIL